MKVCLFHNGETVNIKDSNEVVTIKNSQYVKHLKKYSYTVKEHPATFYFEEELKKL